MVRFTVGVAWPASQGPRRNPPRSNRYQGSMEEVELQNASLLDRILEAHESGDRVALNIPGDLVPNLPNFEMDAGSDEARSDSDLDFDLDSDVGPLPQPAQPAVFVADDQKEGDSDSDPEPVEPSQGPSIAYLVGVALLLATVAAVID